MPTGVIGSRRSRSNGCSSSSVVAELFLRNATPIGVRSGRDLQALLEALLHLVAGERRLQVVRLLVLRAAEPRQDDALAVERDFEIVLELETADDVDRLAIEPRADHVLAVDGEVVADGDAAARADRQARRRGRAARGRRARGTFRGDGVIFGLATARLLIFQAAER